MPFIVVPGSMKAARQKCCKVQDKQTATMAFGSLWVEWELCPLAALCLGSDRQTLFYPGARCRWLDTTQWTNLGTAHARVQQTAGAACWSTTQTALSANSGPDGVVIYPKLTSEKSWPMNSELCFLPFLAILTWKFATDLTFEHVLYFGRLLWVCLAQRFLTRSFNKTLPPYLRYRLFYRLC